MAHTTDSSIPQLVNIEAVEMLGSVSGDVARRLNEKGLLPGRLVQGTEGAPQRLVFRKDRVGRQALSEVD